MFSRLSRARSAVATVSSATGTTFGGSALVPTTRTCCLGGSSTNIQHKNREDSISVGQVQHFHASAYNSSLVSKFWDVVSSSNPLLADIERLFPANANDSNDATAVNLPNLAGIKPAHLIEAAKQIQTTYESEFASLEQDVQAQLDANGSSIDYANVIFRLESISAPLHYILNVRNLLTATNGMDDMLEAGGKVEFIIPVSYTHLRAHETRGNLVCRLLLEKKKSCPA